MIELRVMYAPTKAIDEKGWSDSLDLKSYVS